MLNLFPQHPQVHHRIYKSPPPAPILSQLSPLYTPSQFPQNPIWSHHPIYALVFQVVFSLRVFPTKILYTFLSSPMRARCPAHLKQVGLIGGEVELN
jgi:hypothetical protein